MNSILVQGDPLAPNDCDVIAQRVTLPLAEQPAGSGWQIVTGNSNFNEWWRIAYRYQCSQDPAQQT